MDRPVQARIEMLGQRGTRVISTLLSAPNTKRSLMRPTLSRSPNSKLGGVSNRSLAPDCPHFPARARRDLYRAGFIIGIRPPRIFLVRTQGPVNPKWHSGDSHNPTRL